MLDAPAQIEQADFPEEAPTVFVRPRIRAMGKRLKRVFKEAGAGPLDQLLVQYRGRICPLHRIVELTPTGSSALDVGCGRGTLLVMLALAGKASNGEGFDPSERLIAQALRAAKRLEATTCARLTFVVGSIRTMTLTDRFDVVTMVDVMHHLPRRDRGLAIAQAADALKPGGTLIYKDVVRRPLWRRLANRAHDLLLAQQWIQESPIERVETWARDAGLTLERAERIDMLWYGHDLRVFRKPLNAAKDARDA